MPFNWKVPTEAEWDDMLGHMTPDTRVLVAGWDMVMILTVPENENKFRTLIWAVYHDTPTFVEAE